MALPRVVQPAAFMGGQGAKARSIAYCDDGTVPTLKASPSGGNTVPGSPCIDRSANIVCYEGQNLCCDAEKAFTLQSGRPDQQHIPSVVYSAASYGGYEQGVGTLRASGERCCGGGVLLCDARGNGDGRTSPTLTGGHENRITDYTAVLVEEK